MSALGCAEPRVRLTLVVMKTRFRFLSALLTVLLFQAEGLSASACSREMGGATSGQMADMDSDACANGHTEHSSGEHGPKKTSPCPLVAVSVCAGAMGLPQFSAAPAVFDLHGTPALASSDHAKDLLLANALLRPPRA